jgi:hypothetical protein
MMKIHTSSTSVTDANAVWRSIQHDAIDANRRSQSRLTVVPDLFASSGPEEVLVVEERANLRPAQVVESKLTRLLQEASFPVSHLQTRGLLKTR